MPYPPVFPPAQQAQIIRANQRDLYHVSSLRDQTDNALRSWLGTRWLGKWDKEVDLCVKLAYYGLTIGRATQTLGEEYTDIWQYSATRNINLPSRRLRIALILISTFPSYLVAKWNQSSLNARYPWTTKWLKRLLLALEIATELNVAAFYINGTYYSLVKRALGLRYLSSIPNDPHTRPPSYSLLGILIGIRLLYRAVTAYRENFVHAATRKEKHTAANAQENYLDERPLSSYLNSVDLEDQPAKPAEKDEATALDVTTIPEVHRGSRNCTLCLEERTDSCSTECGHLFCWGCIVGWGREKPECPLCRQSLNLARLLPIYNL
ncbi:Pex12 amino terminal region-domain-containing protein [Crucibulum laeve]|uniref:RING-type E3 ubiquitin transferase n=1 Tax=Crucibulum laeve TaxID=68775 RepID=A0A5C3M634_9AGAR|nr:Pex12 amino terminal region-domain-containing protein [Crucibulum laeve]